MGIAPSMALLRHFFVLCLVDGRRRSGCVSLQTVAVLAGSGIDFAFRMDTTGYRKWWVYVDAGVLSPLLLLSSMSVAPSSGWGHMKLTDCWLRRVWARLARL